ncbi:lysophospholipid acyltransferase family protein [Parasedimentitalea psychrophila]
MTPLQRLRAMLFSVQMYPMMLVIGLLYAPWAIFSKHGARACCKAYANWIMWTAGWMVGIRCEVRGTPPAGGALIAAKHQSFLDILMIFAALPTGRFIMKKEILRMPVIGQYARLLGCVAVDRAKRGGAIDKMVQDAEASDEEAGQLIIFAQGTRVVPGVKAPYKVGAGVLYEQLNQTCVPVAVNVGLMWPRKGITRLPGVAVIEFLEPIEPGLERKEFLNLLEQRVEAGSDALMREAGFDPAPAVAKQAG